MCFFSLTILAAKADVGVSDAVMLNNETKIVQKTIGFDLVGKILVNDKAYNLALLEHSEAEEAMRHYLVLAFIILCCFFGFAFKSEKSSNSFLSKKIVLDGKEYEKNDDVILDGKNYTKDMAHRVPDNSGRYTLVIPKLLVGDREQVVKVWGTDCNNLHAETQHKRIKNVQVSLFCMPYVNDISAYIENGEIEAALTGYIQFKNGPSLLMVPKFSDDPSETKRQKDELDAYIKSNGDQAPLDAEWVRFGFKYGGYVKVKDFIKCPQSHSDASFCVRIDSYIAYSKPRAGDMYGVYCWRNCAKLRESIRSLQKDILFGLDSAELLFDGAYAQPFWRERRDRIDIILKISMKYREKLDDK